jgi:hypothetical protein
MSMYTVNPKGSKFGSKGVPTMGFQSVHSDPMEPLEPQVGTPLEPNLEPLILSWNLYIGQWEPLEPQVGTPLEPNLEPLYWTVEPEIGTLSGTSKREETKCRDLRLSI